MDKKETKVWNEQSTILLVDKPSTWTSNDVVRYLKFHYHYKKIGHAGTLDPLATGLLIIGTNHCTKDLNNLLHVNKSYLVSIKFHFATNTYDLDTTQVDCYFDEPFINKQQLINALDYFVSLNPYWQIPPKFSAIKINGQKAYDLARNNIEFKLAPKQVYLYKYYDLIFNDAKQELTFKIDCSGGFYVRSLVNDLATKLCTHAVLIGLRRTNVGPYSINDPHVINIKKED